MKSRKNFISLVIILIFAAVHAQKPTEVPKPSESPIDITNPADIIIYIVLPLCAIMLYFIWRNKRKKRNKR